MRPDRVVRPGYVDRNYAIENFRIFDVFPLESSADNRNWTLMSSQDEVKHGLPMET